MSDTIKSVIEYDINLGKTNDKVKNLTSGIKDLKTQEEALNKALKDGKITNEAYEKALDKITSAQKKQSAEANSLKNSLQSVNDTATKMGGPGAKAVQALTSSVGGLNTAFKALVGNPVVAVVTVLVGVFMKLKDAIAGNEETQNRLNKVFSRFRPIGLAVSNIFDKIAGFLVTCVEKFSQFIPAVLNGIKTVSVFITKFGPLGKLLKSFGIDLGETISKIVDEFTKQGDVTESLEDRAQKLAKAQREFADEQAETQDKISELQEEIQSSDITDAERVEKTKEIGDLRVSLAKKERDLKAEELSIAEENAKLAANSAADNEKLAKLRTEQAQLQRKVNKEEKKARTEASAAEKKLSSETKKNIDEKNKSLEEELKKRREIENNIADLRIELIADEKKREEARINEDRRKKLQAIDDVYKKSSKSQQKLYDEQKILINQVADLKINELYGKDSKSYKSVDLIYKRIADLYRTVIEKSSGSVLEAAMIKDEEAIEQFRKKFFTIFSNEDEYTTYVAALFNDINRLRALYPELVKFDPLDPKYAKNFKKYFEEISLLTRAYDDTRSFQSELNDLVSKNIEEQNKSIELKLKSNSLTIKERKNLEKELTQNKNITDLFREREQELGKLKLKYADLKKEAELYSEAELERLSSVVAISPALYKESIAEIEEVLKKEGITGDELTERVFAAEEELKDSLNNYYRIYSEESLRLEQTLGRKLTEKDKKTLENSVRSRTITYEVYAESIEKVEEAKNQQLLQYDLQYNEAKEKLELLYDEKRFNREKEILSRLKEINKQAALDTINLWSDAFGNIGSIFDALAEHERENSKRQYRLQTMAVYLNMASALAKGISGAAEAGWPAMLATIPATVATLISQFAQVKSLQAKASNANYAEGGLITGKGSGTSDSIRANVSNGESVINAKATSMYAPLLSAVNQSTGGAPIISGRNNHILAKELALAISAQPAPVVSVQDINTGQNRVKYVRTLGSI